MRIFKIADISSSLTGDGGWGEIKRKIICFVTIMAVH